MARFLHRSKATIHRELKLNFFSDECMPKCDGYYGAAAHLMQADRRARQRKLNKYTELCNSVVARLKKGWTPQQIGNRMIYDGAKQRVCQEAIYRYIYSKEGMRDELWWYLPTHRMPCKPRRARKRLPPKLHRDVSILFRPDEVTHRRQFGHWKGDLMAFEQKLGQTNVTSLVERVSRFTVIFKNPTKGTKPVMGAIRDLLWSLADRSPSTAGPGLSVGPIYKLK